MTDDERRNAAAKLVGPARSHSLLHCPNRIEGCQGGVECAHRTVDKLLTKSDATGEEP
jgi:hypothetical protein